MPLSLVVSKILYSRTTVPRDPNFPQNPARVIPMTIRMMIPEVVAVAKEVAKEASMDHMTTHQEVEVKEAREERVVTILPMTTPMTILTTQGNKVFS